MRVLVLDRCLKTPIPLVLPPTGWHASGMKWLFHPLLLLIAKSTESELAMQVEYLKAENQILRSRIRKRVMLQRGAGAAARGGRPRMADEIRHLS